MTIDFEPVYGAENAVDHGGLKLDSPNVYLIFWGGSTWLTPQGLQLEDAVVADAKTLLSSGYFLGLTQYGVDGTPHFGGSANDFSDPPQDFSQSDLQSVIQNAISSGEFPAPFQLADNPIYVVLTPPGIESTVSDAGGYNNHGIWWDGLTPTSLIYDWVGDAFTDPGFNLGLSFHSDIYTKVLSHELVETITDPLQGSGIEVTAGAYDPSASGGNLGQIADFDAENISYRLGGPGGIEVQSYWSQRDQAFIIPDGSPLTFWIDGSDTLWVLPEQGTAYDDNYVAIGLVDDGLDIRVDSSNLWFDPGVALAGIDVFLTGSNDLLALDQVPQGCPVIADLEASNCALWIGSGADLSGIQSNVTVGFFENGANVIVDDASDANSVYWNIQAGSIGWGGTGSITLMGQNGNGNAVTIDGGSGQNDYTVDDSPGAFATTINTGNGDNYFSIYDSAEGLTINTGAGTNYVDVGGPAGGDAAYLDGNVSVNGGSGGSTYVWILDYSNTTPTTWYYFSLYSTSYWPSGSPYTINLASVSGIDFWGSSTDTLIQLHLRPLASMAETASPGAVSGPTGAMGPQVPAGPSGEEHRPGDPGNGSNVASRTQDAGGADSPSPAPSRASFIAGAMGTQSDTLHDLALKSILAESLASELPALRIGPIATGGRTRTV